MRIVDFILETYLDGYRSMVSRHNIFLRASKLKECMYVKLKDNQCVKVTEQCSEQLLQISDIEVITY